MMANLLLGFEARLMARELHRVPFSQHGLWQNGAHNQQVQKYEGDPSRTGKQPGAPPL